MDTVAEPFSSATCGDRGRDVGEADDGETDATPPAFVVTVASVVAVGIPLVGDAASAADDDDDVDPG